MSDALEAVPLIQCSKCKEWKPATLEHFAVANTTKRGWQYRCKRCKSTKKPSKVREGYKLCSRCKEEKPATLQYFMKQNRGPMGLTPQCKECQKKIREAKHYEWQAPANPEEIGEKKCTLCGSIYPATPKYFVRKRSNPSGLNSWCKPCRDARAKVWARENPQKRSAIAQRWLDQNPEWKRDYARKHDREKPEFRSAIKQRYKARKRKLPAAFSASDWQRALDYFRGFCAVCERPTNGMFHAVHADHWIPLSSPDCPGTIPKNMVPLCGGTGGCNTSKGSKHPHAWLTSKFGKHKAASILARIEAYFASLV